MASWPYNATGVCQTDHTGNFKATLIKKDREGTLQYFDCNNASWTKLMESLYYLLFGPESEGIIAGQHVKKTYTKNQSRAVVKLNLGSDITLSLLTTPDKPGQAFLSIVLPFAPDYSGSFLPDEGW